MFLTKFISYFVSVNPTQSNEHLPDFELSELQRKTRLLQILALIMAITNFAGVIAYGFLAILLGHFLLLAGTITEFVALLGFLASARLAGAGRYNLACWLLISNNLASLIFACTLAGTGVELLLAFMMPLSMAIVLMPTSSLMAVFAFVIAFNTCWYIGQQQLKIFAPLVSFSPEMQLYLNIFLILLLFPTILALLRIPIQLQLRAMQTQNERLQQALAQSEARQHSGKLVSEKVFSLAAQLTSTAGQQASGSQEQVAVVSQVNAAVSELTATAGNIDELSAQVNSASNQVAADTYQIEKTSLQAVQQSVRGLEAVEHTVAVSQQTASLYQQLQSTMEELADKNANMRTILALLGSIAGETHLLSLNAAIEAAGAGQYGERFGVVAQEIKRLAARSASASKEVVVMIEELESVTERAVSASQQGYLQAQEMIQSVKGAGEVIHQMRQVAQASQTQVSSISVAIQQVKELTEIIRSATGQQRSASEQVLQALHGLSTVAHESAEGSSMVSTAAVNLAELSQHLNLTLAA